MLRILTQLLDLLFNIAAGLFLLRLFLNEISPSPFNPVIRFLHRVTEPLLRPIRRVLPNGLKDKLYIDISPLIAFLLIMALKFAVIKAFTVLFLWYKAGPPRPKLN